MINPENSVVSPAEVWDEYYISLHAAHNALQAAFTGSGITREELANRLGIDKSLIPLNGSENLTLKTLSHMGVGLGYRLVVTYVPLQDVFALMDADAPTARQP